MSEHRHLGPSFQLRSPSNSATEIKDFPPRQTVRCEGRPSYRNQLARDAACLFDIDQDVLSWRCSVGISKGVDTYVADFEVRRERSIELVAVTLTSEDNPPAWVADAAAESGRTLRTVSEEDISEERLDDARDLLRYADWKVTLHDRIRLLAALDELGSLTLAECLPVFRDAANPVAAAAALFLRRFIDLDFEGARIGPETRVRRAS